MMVTRLRSCLRAIENKALQHPTHPDLTPQKSPARSPHPDDSVATQCTCVEHRCHPGFVPFPRSRPSNDPDDGASCHVPEVRRQHHGRAGRWPKRRDRPKSNAGSPDAVRGASRRRCPQGWSVALSADANTTIMGGTFDNSQAGEVCSLSRQFRSCKSRPPPTLSPQAIQAARSRRHRLVTIHFIHLSTRASVER
jgi:hypothetical protein